MLVRIGGIKMIGEMISTQETYGKTLVELGEKNKDIFALEADLMRCSGSKLFEDKYPDRHIQLGIAEQNLVGVAAGLAAMGRIPYASTFANFLTQRGCDQIVMSLAYNKFNVKLVGSYAGISSGSNGGTHIAVCDVAITRCIPNMKVMDPADCNEFRQAIIATSKDDSPTYIRQATGPLKTIFDDTYKFEIGKGYKFGNGKDITLVSAGITTSLAMDAMKELEKEKIKARLIHLPTLKPADSDLIIECARATGAILTIENHSILGGLGGLVSEIVSKNYPVIMDSIGLKDTWGLNAPLAYQLKYFGFTVENIIKKSKELIAKK
jgi:transketolase